MGDLLDQPLSHGVVPTTITICGVLAGLVLLIRPRRTWWWIVVPTVGTASVLVSLLLTGVIEAWKLFPDNLPWRVPFWVAVALGAIGLAAASFRRTTWVRRVLAGVTASLVLCTAAMKINAYYGEFPTTRAALGLPTRQEVNFAAVPPARPKFHRLPGQPLVDAWEPPLSLPATGVLSQVSIPGAISGFPASRNAYLYLPPAYLTADRPPLPVLMLLHGQPGDPSEWVDAGNVAPMMDAYAAEHHGLAPVVVMPDDTGGGLNNPLCLDSALGNSETYLTRDVPDWVRENLTVDADTRHWAVGGFSYGGTCSLQLALRRPDLFSTFVDISGQREPTLGSHPDTVRKAFGGDESRFRAVNPLDELRNRKYPGTEGLFASGAKDAEYGPQQRDVYAACQNDGITVRWLEVPGPHTWKAWSAALGQSLDWLGARTGITRE